MIGFAAVREEAMDKGMELLAAALDATSQIDVGRGARTARR
jgi:hypothetical protein